MLCTALIIFIRANAVADVEGTKAAQAGDTKSLKGNGFCNSTKKYDLCVILYRYI